MFKKLKRIVVLAVILAISLYGLAVVVYAINPPSLTVEELFTGTNELRDKPLVLDKALSATAKLKCAEMSRTNIYDHGKNWADKLRPLNRRIYGENLVVYVNDSKQAVKSWRDSPGHYRNIVDPGYGRVGFAICHDEGVGIVVQHFSD